LLNKPRNISIFLDYAGGTLLCNLGIYLPDCTASNLRKSLWGPQASLLKIPSALLKSQNCPIVNGCFI